MSSNQNIKILLGSLVPSSIDGGDDEDSREREIVRAATCDSNGGGGGVGGGGGGAATKGEDVCTGPTGLDVLAAGCGLG